MTDPLDFAESLQDLTKAIRQGIDDTNQAQEEAWETYRTDIDSGTVRPAPPLAVATTIEEAVQLEAELRAWEDTAT